MEKECKWWQSGVIYQIYPRSFQDSNGDGVGDLPGITSRLDYLHDLGVDAIWLSPIFRSPMADFGYDVADYTAIEPIFGTMEEFDRLVAETHRRGMKVILDYVPNHTSEQHEWFREARASRDNPKRDWYLWSDPAPGGGPPNNWQSVFGGSAWELDEASGQYYYHAFLKQQPDLNWRSPEVQEAMLDVLRFWMDRGVDGFRIDVIWHLIKDRELRDNPVNPDHGPDQSPHRRYLEVYNVDRPEVHEIVAMMREVSDGYEDRVLIGEIYLPVERLVTYYGEEGEGVHLPYNFQLVELPWEARTIARMVNEYEALLPEFAWPNWVLGNHDKPRIATRVGLAHARAAAVLLLTLRGTPTIYYGDEIGMTNVAIPPDRIQDPYEKNVPGLGLGRDPQRTPMQWSAARHAGFTQGTPWLPLGAADLNVEKQLCDPDSMLALHRRLIELRRREPALSVGDYAPLEAGGTLMAWVRKKGSRFLFVAVNMGDEEQSFDLAGGKREGRILLGTHLDREGDRIGKSVVLRAAEAIVVEAL
ncbi:MAG: alpha-amylase family glycosyl hydrolase [Thermoanaerobaculia bacterium]